jgi:hypothetical protein
VVPEVPERAIQGNVFSLKPIEAIPHVALTHAREVMTTRVEVKWVPHSWWYYQLLCE